MSYNETWDLFQDDFELVVCSRAISEKVSEEVDNTRLTAWQQLDLELGDTLLN